MKEIIVDRIPQTVYWLNGFMYVPHLTKDDAYVRPGYGRHDVRFWSSQQLKLLGALEAKHLLADRKVDLPDKPKKGK